MDGDHASPRYPGRMTDEQLEAFLAVARLRSVSRAAEALRLAQPTVSDRLRALERDLGTPVVRRRGRGIDLTPAGRAALEPLRRAAAARTEARAALRAVAAGQTARVELAVSVTAGAYLVATALVAFRAAHRAVDVAVRSVHTDDALGLLVEGAVDLAVTSAPILHPRIDRLGSGRAAMVLVAGRGTAFARRRRYTAADLRAAPLRTSSWGPAYARFLEDVRAGTLPASWTETSPVELVKSLVEAGAGVSLVPRAAVRAHLESGRLVALRFEGRPLPAWQVHLSARRGPRPEAVEALTTALRAALPDER